MKDRLYIGVDVGGTKISAGVVTPKGKILHWEKCPTPQRANARTIYNTIVKTLNDLLNAENLQPQNLAGIGLGIPGIVSPQSQKILVTPNIQLAGFPLVEELGKKFSVPIVMDNDVNVGLLGEKWLGAAQNTRNVVGLFPGTGIGGAIIVNDKLFSGSHGAAAELGHMIVDPDGPVCSCGNQGCLEALASRWAIERDIRAAIKRGERTMIFDLMRDNEGVIKSRFLKQAIAQQDRLILAILEKVAVTLGKACVSIRHILDPEMIVLGGGVIEACSDFILPRIQKELQADPFFTPKIGTCPIFASQLGDDAIILGAVALVKQHQSMSDPASTARESLPLQIRSVRPGEISIDGKIYRQDIYLLPD